MLPDRLEFLNRYEKFYSLMKEQAIQSNVSESEFYLIMICKLKAMNRERREKGK